MFVILHGLGMFVADIRQNCWEGMMASRNPAALVLDVHDEARADRFSAISNSSSPSPSVTIVGRK